MNILTFDIEEWFLSRDDGQKALANWNDNDARVEKNTRTILDLLDLHDQKATFFILGRIAEKYPDVLKLIDSAGHETGYHSYAHQSIRTLMHLNRFEDDLHKGLDIIQQITGKKVISYRAPFFSLKGSIKPVLETLLINGIQTDSSIKAYSGHETYFHINEPFKFKVGDRQLIELPLNRLNLPFVKPVFTGSGFIRILPGTVINNLFKKSRYNLTYFHPRDFDTAVPFSRKLSFSRNFLNRIGNSSTSKKLSYLLTTHKFLTVAEAAELISAIPVIPTITIP